MRLRFLIRRNGLPDAAVVWAIQDGDNPTISQLLEQVNEIVPLESGGDWGLEDYVVELRGFGSNFECFHFQLIHSVLHEDDELFIRPLLSQDLKQRKVSGRHQITSDGKHLIDGCTFGRPRPQGPIDRPAIEIPSRKRKRVTHEGDTGSIPDGSILAIEAHSRIMDDQDGNRQLIIRADFEDDDEDDEDDEDFEPDDEEEMEEELEICEDPAVIESEEGDAHSEYLVASSQNDDMRLNVNRLREAFPKAPLPLCEHVLLGSDGDLNKAWETLTHAFKPAKSRKAIVTTLKNPENPPQNRQAKIKPSKGKRKNFRDQDMHVDRVDEDSEAPTEESNHGLLSHYDQHGLPSGSISTGKALSHMAEIISLNTPKRTSNSGLAGKELGLPNSTTRSTRSVRFAEDNPVAISLNSLALEEDESDDGEFDVESFTTDSNESSAETSGDASSSSGYNPKIVHHLNPTSSSEGDTSSSGSSSSSDSEPDEVTSRPAESPSVVQPSIVGGDAMPSFMSPSANPNIQQKSTAPPGQGKKSTRARNQRRRNANILQRFQEKGILPAGTTLKEFGQLNMASIETPGDALGALAEIRAENSREDAQMSEKAKSKVAEFEMRRQQLLTSIASGGVEVDSEVSVGPSAPIAATSISISVETGETPLILTTMNAEIALPPRTTEDELSHSGGVVEANKISKSAPEAALAESLTNSVDSAAVDTSSRPRRRLDLGAAGRLLFGALGVRTPKTKADQEKVRNDLMKKIKPQTIASASEPTTEGADPPSLADDPEAWREVITLRAVECCHKDIELSPAPFPFVQRWDVQQRGISLKQSNLNGKGKNPQRNQPRYYEKQQHISKKQKRKHPSTYESDHYAIAEPDEKGENSHHNEMTGLSISNDMGTQNLGSKSLEDAANDQIMRDVREAATSQGLDGDDLPKLPADISTLPEFTSSDARTGVVVAFKQLLLSEITNWQPQMSSYRTAVVSRASETGELELILAKRDRGFTEKQYDIETGERIYGKFEMPDDDDEDKDDNEDDGTLSLTIHELVEPRIVQQAFETPSSQQATAETSQTKANNSIDDSTTLYYEEFPEKSKVLEEVPKGDVIAASPHNQSFHDSESPSMRGGELSSDDAEEILELSISEDTREEISEIIKEAGFRSTVPSSVLKARPELLVTSRGSSPQGIYSPKFNGFGSSQSIEVISSPSHFRTTTPEIGNSLRLPECDNQGVENHSPALSVHYPKLSVPSSLASLSQVSDRGRQPDYPTPGDDTLEQFDEINSSVLPVADDEYITAEQPSSTVDTPQIKQSPSRQHQLVDPPSSGDLPTLDEVFSTARGSAVLKQEKGVVRPGSKALDKEADRIADSYNKAMEALDAELDEDEDPEQLTPKASQNNRRKPAKISVASQKDRFQIPPGSQQVDLTLSSDVEAEVEKEDDGDESYDDSFGLPKGPGWVEKNTRNLRRHSSANSRAPSQSSQKSKTSRRKSMKRF